VNRQRISYDTWVAAGWTLGRALRTARFWWVPIGYFGALFAWYAVQAQQTKHLIEFGFSAQTAAWALGLVGSSQCPGRLRWATCPIASAASGCGRAQDSMAGARKVQVMELPPVETGLTLSTLNVAEVRSRAIFTPLARSLRFLPAASPAAATDPRLPPVRRV